MDNDFKLFIWLIVLIIVFPLTGLGISEWRKQDCRVELAKAGKSIDEIKEICK